MNRIRKEKKRILCISIVMALVLSMTGCSGGDMSATTMRILRFEGDVVLKDNGSDATIRENVRLKSGNSLETKDDSLSSIGLDDTKIVTMDENSLAEFNQLGKKLNLQLKNGNVFFEVTKPLDDDEKLDIKTSTMVVGIRGTSGDVFEEDGQEGLIICDGTVHVSAKDPITGREEETDVHAGERAVLTTDTKFGFTVEKITEHELPEFVLEQLRSNLELLDKVVAETGWDKDWILGLSMDEEPVSEEPENDTADAAKEKPAEPEAATETTAEPAEDTSGEEIAEAEDDTTAAASSDNSQQTTNSENSSNSDSSKKNSSERSKDKRSAVSQSQLAAARRAIAATDATTGMIVLADGTLFDPNFYATLYPDVANKYGTDPVALVAHYLAYGANEGRMTYLPTPTPTPTPEPIPSWVWLAQPTRNPDEPDPYGERHDEEHRSSHSSKKQAGQGP